jgi:hypothetical protein
VVLLEKLGIGRTEVTDTDLIKKRGKRCQRRVKAGLQN